MAVRGAAAAWARRAVWWSAARTRRSGHIYMGLLEHASLRLACTCSPTQSLRHHSGAHAHVNAKSRAEPMSPPGAVTAHQRAAHAPDLLSLRVPSPWLQQFAHPVVLRRSARLYAATLWQAVPLLHAPTTRLRPCLQQLPPPAHRCQGTPPQRSLPSVRPLAGPVPVLAAGEDADTALAAAAGTLQAAAAAPARVVAEARSAASHLHDQLQH